MKPAIIYVREIRGEQIQEQIDRRRPFCDTQGWQALATVVDLSVPGPAYRLGLRGALDMVTSGDVEVFVALNSEQVSKDPLRLRDLQEMLREKNCELHYVEGTEGS